MGETQGIPENRRLTLGGRGSLRSLPEGFLQQSNISGLKAQRLIETKVEYRQPVLGDLGMAFFHDSGFLVAPGVASTGFRQGVGVGFRLGTPVGPVALDFGLNIDPRPDEDSFRFYLSIGSF